MDTISDIISPEDDSSGKVIFGLPRALEIDEAGMPMLLWSEITDNGGIMRLAGVPTTLWPLVETSGLLGLMGIYGDITEAMHSMDLQGQRTAGGLQF